MQRRKAYSRSSRKAGFLLCFLLILALIFFVLVDIRIRPMLKTYGMNQATTTATKSVNDAVNRVLSEQSLNYEDLATVHKDSEGKIISVESDTTQMNILKSAISDAVLQELNRQNSQMVKIPLGSILAGGLLTGRGPDICVKVPMNSTVETAFINKFEGAGINQTRHEITLDVKVTVYAMLPGQDSAAEVETGFTVAETVLVGEVPQWTITK